MNSKLVSILFLIFTIAQSKLGAIKGLSDYARKAQREISAQMAAASGAQNEQKQVHHEPAQGTEFTEQDVADIENDEQIEDTLTPEDNTQLNDEDLAKIWEENMRGFIPDDLSTFIVKGSHAITLYEDIMHQKPTQIKGAYYAQDGKGKYINVFVIDPDNQVIFKRTGEVQGIVTFDTTSAGKYTFIFSNLDDWTDRTVTFALHTYQERDEEIQYTISDDGEINLAAPTVETKEEVVEIEIALDKDVMQVRQSLKKVLESSQEIQSEVKMSFTRQKVYNNELTENGNWYYWAMLVEVLCFIVILGWQLSHIKSKLDQRIVF